MLLHSSPFPLASSFPHQQCPSCCSSEEQSPPATQALSQIPDSRQHNNKSHTHDNILPVGQQCIRCCTDCAHDCQTSNIVVRFPVRTASPIKVFRAMTHCPHELLACEHQLVIDHPTRQHLLAETAARMYCYCCWVLDGAVTAISL